MQTKKTNFDAENFCERRLLFLNSENSTADLQAENTENSEISVSQKDTDDFSKEVLEQDLGLSNSAENFDAEIDAAELMDGTRSQLAKLFGSRAATAENILERRVTDALKQFVAKNYEGKQAKKLTKLVEKNQLASQFGKLEKRESVRDSHEILSQSTELLRSVGAEIGSLENEISENYKAGEKKDTRYFEIGKRLSFLRERKKELEKIQNKNFGDLLTLPLRTPAGFFEEELDDLADLQKEKARIEKEETEKLAREWAWIDSISEESLKTDFGWAGEENPNPAEDWQKKLVDRLSPRELENWKENETTRILMRHLQTENFQRILNSKPVNGIKTHFGQTPEAESLAREKREIQGKEAKELAELKDLFFGIDFQFEVGGQQKSVADLIAKDFANLVVIENLKKSILEKIAGGEINSADAEEITKELQAQVDEQKKMIEKLEVDKEKKEKERQAILKDRGNPPKNLDSDGVKKWVEKADEESVLLLEEIGVLDGRIKGCRAEIQNLKSDEIREKQVEKRLAAKTSAHEAESFKKKGDRAFEILDSFAAGVKRKKEIEIQISESRESADKTDSRTLFTRLMVERAKVDECRRIGKKNTVELSDDAAARATKIGELAAKTRLEEWSAGAIKKKNFERLQKVSQKQKKEAGALSRFFVKKKDQAKEVWGGVAERFNAAVDAREFKMFGNPFKSSKKSEN